MIELKTKQIDQLESQLKQELADKKDFEKLCVDFQAQNKKMMTQQKKLEEEIDRKAFEVGDQAQELQYLQTQFKEQEGKLKKTDLKLRQLQFTQVKDLQRMIKQKDE